MPRGPSKDLAVNSAQLVGRQLRRIRSSLFPRFSSAPIPESAPALLPFRPGAVHLQKSDPLLGSPRPGGDPSGRGGSGARPRPSCETMRRSDGRQTIRVGPLITPAPRRDGPANNEQSARPRPRPAGHNAARHEAGRRRRHHTECRDRAAAGKKRHNSTLCHGLRKRRVSAVSTTASDFADRNPSEPLPCENETVSHRMSGSK